MALPKAILCLLEDASQHTANAEGALRASGFATATIPWKEVLAQPSGIAELAEVLQDDAIKAWVVCGPESSFTPTLRSQVALITLALQRQELPQTVLLSTGPTPPQGASLPHIQSFCIADPFAAKLMAGRFKPASVLELPFYLHTHLDPYVGTWLEMGPPIGEQWHGFMAGLLKEEEDAKTIITAFGVGARGVLPSKSTLEYPLQGIEGHQNGTQFVACAAKNTITDKLAVFLRLEGTPTGVLLSGYPEDEAEELCGDTIMLV